MSPFAHQSRYFKAEDFDPQPRVMRYFWIVVLLLFIAILCMVAYAVGDKRGYENGKAHGAIATRVVPAANPPHNLIPCNDPLKSRELVNQICRARRNAI